MRMLLFCLYFVVCRALDKYWQIPLLWDFGLAGWRAKVWWRWWYHCRKVIWKANFVVFDLWRPCVSGVALAAPLFGKVVGRFVRGQC